MNDKRYAYYNYGIDNISQNEKNKNIIDIHYGNGKVLLIFKDDLLDFMKAIVPADERARGIDDNSLLSYMPQFVEGRGMVLITNFKDYSEYANGGQIDILRIAGMKINGELNIEESFDYANRQPSYDEIYHPSTKK